MSDTTAPAAPAQSTPAPAPAPAAATSLPPELQRLIDSPEAFKQRLAEERAAGERAALKALGLDTLDAGKARLSEAEKLRQAQMTEQQRLQAEMDALKAQAAQATKHAETISQFAALEVGALDEKQRAYVKSLAGDDPAAQLRAITAARQHGIFTAPPPSNAAAPGAPPSPAPKPPNPATTAPPPGPTPTTPTATLSPRQQYKALKEGGRQLVAAAYYKANRAAIDADTQ